MTRQTMYKYHGQTIIETVVGIFIMVMGITAAISVATYSFAQSTTVVKQLVGMGLAREAMEAVKNMRDTNWLKGSLVSTCWNYQTSSLTANCYPTWQSSFYGSSPSTTRPLLAGTYLLDLDSTVADSSTYWRMTTAAGNYRLYLNANPANGGYYTVTNTGTLSDYYRKIIIVEETPAYYAASVGPRLRVTVQVWWIDKGCAATNTFPGQSHCGIQLDTYLTNWKNY